jgi:AcrR family transcriptional regulator
LSPDDRRAAIIAATQPLLREYGVLVTTSQIAQAAGIAEGTIFRVFPDKRQLIAAALHTAMCGDAEVERILEIPPAVPLPERLAAALRAIADYQERFWALVRVFRETGWPAETDALRAQAHTERPMARIRAAMSQLFAPDAGSLWLEPDEAARMLLALAFGDRMTSHGLGESPHTPEELVDRFLRGAFNPRSELESNA